MFLVSAHRSGSLHIAKSLARATGRTVLTPVLLRYPSGREEHTIQPLLSEALFGLNNFVFHIHLKAPGFLFDQRPAVVVRNIFDSMLSAKECFDRGESLPGIHLPATWASTAEFGKWRWLAYHYVPWQIQFCASWLESAHECMFVPYSIYYKDQKSGLDSILQWFGVEQSADAGIDVNDNLSHGVSGRGRTLCPGYIKNMVREAMEWGNLSSSLIHLLWSE